MKAYADYCNLGRCATRRLLPADELIQRKLNNVELPLRKCVRQIAQILAAPTSAVEGDSAMTSVAGFEVDEAAKAAQVWSVFSAQLREVELGVKKVGIVERMEARMRAKYEAKGRQMGASFQALGSSSEGAELTVAPRDRLSRVQQGFPAAGDRCPASGTCLGRAHAPAQTRLRCRGSPGPRCW